MLLVTMRLCLSICSDFLYILPELMQKQVTRIRQNFNRSVCKQEACFPESVLISMTPQCEQESVLKFCWEKEMWCIVAKFIAFHTFHSAGERMNEFLSTEERNDHLQTTCIWTPLNHPFPTLTPFPHPEVTCGHYPVWTSPDFWLHTQALASHQTSFALE